MFEGVYYRCYNVAMKSLSGKMTILIVHAVKSSSKTIGAVELSGIAAMLEAAAKDGDLKYAHYIRA